MKENSKQTLRKYFAAANSYGGFVSLFDEVFNSESFSRIFVLKGGPGTGKSSFMKKISAELKEKGCDVDEIYCSSDPHSLDGVIAKKNDKKIAIIDGTAPHERDAVIPGAIDEIINLGNAWDDRWLKTKRNKILDITSEKRKAYKTAYSYLKIAGNANDFILRVYNDIFDKIKAKSKAEEILSSIPPSNNRQITSCFISSFGRYGSYKIGKNDYDFGRIIHVGGDELSTEIFIDLLYQTALSKDLSFVTFKSPLNPSYNEGIFFENAGITVLKSDISDINSNEFLLNDKLYSERTRRALEIKRLALEEAERWFSIASELHFKLEEIYGAAMDFSQNDELFVKKISQIENILEL